MNAINLSPSRACQYSNPHRPDLGTAKHRKAGPTRAITRLEFPKQLFGVSNAFINHAAYRTASRGQALPNATPGFRVGPVTLTDPTLR